MLQKSTVTDATYKLLIQLMQDENLQDFYLVGETSIALRIGHRISIDLEIYSRAAVVNNPERVCPSLEA